MTKGLDRNQTTFSSKVSPRAGLAQVSAGGLAFLGALLLAALVFLASGRGNETEALGIFPAWAFLFVILIRRATSWRQPVARGLALLGAEFLAFPLAWLLYQGLPSLSGGDPRLLQTLGVLALGLSLAAPLLVGGFWLHRRWGKGPVSPGGYVLPATATLLFLLEAAYALLLWARSLGG